MRITHVAVEGCGRFGTPARIDNLAPGVNILAARNEAGKSTIFKAIRTCLFERHTAGSKEVQDLATEGLTLPLSISVGFEHAGEAYEIRKSFLRSKSASLLKAGGEIARNAAADEMVWDLLGLGARPTRSLDDADFGLLWVAQGQSFLAPEPSGEAQRLLNDVIQQEVGTLVGGDRARGVLASVKDELAKQVTDTGKPRKDGPLQTATARHAEIAASLLDAETRLRNLEADLETLSRLRAEQKRVSDPADAQKLKSELEEARQKLQLAEDAALAIARLADEERQARALLAARDDKLTALRDLARRIDENRFRIKSLGEQLAPLDERLKNLSGQSSEAQARQSAAAQRIEALRRESLLLQQMEKAQTRAAARQPLALRLAALEAFEAERTSTESQLKALTVDDAALKVLEAIERDEAVAKARREAAATRLTITPGEGDAVSIDGKPLTGALTHAVTEPLTITVGSTRIAIAPPPSGDAEKDWLNLQDKRRTLFARHGVADAVDFRAQRAARIEAEGRARDLRATRAALGIPEASALSEIRTLTDQIAQIDAELARLTAATPSTALLSAPDIEARRSRLDAELDSARADAMRAEGEQKALSTNLGRLIEERATLKGQSDAIAAQRGADLALLPDDRRAATIEAAEQDRESFAATVRAKRADYEARRTAAPADGEVDRLKARVERLLSAQRNQAAAAETLRQQIARLEGEVKALGGEGLGETVAALRLEQDVALAELSRQTERVEVLNLLRNVVEEAYDKRREQLNAPLRRHLKPFLDDVFPQAELDLGEEFRVAGFRRSGPAAELFGRLSAGTQEQLAVLVRLAMGAMISERGRSVPIILDDALVFSDDDRIEQMFDALSRAGRNQQVIVLTCRARSFASLGGHQLQIG